MEKRGESLDLGVRCKRGKERDRRPCWKPSRLWGGARGTGSPGTVGGGGRPKETAESQQLGKPPNSGFLHIQADSRSLEPTVQAGGMPAGGILSSVSSPGVEPGGRIHQFPAPSPSLQCQVLCPGSPWPRPPPPPAGRAGAGWPRWRREPTEEAGPPQVLLLAGQEVKSERRARLPGTASKPCSPALPSLAAWRQ